MVKSAWNYVRIIESYIRSKETIIIKNKNLNLFLDTFLSFESYRDIRQRVVVASPGQRGGW